MPYLAGFITPQDYGATGNGVTDDTAAVQAAANAAAGEAILYFPGGTYKLSSAITLPSTSSYTSWLGAGSGISVISQTTTTANGLTGTDLTNITLSGLSITGPGSGSGVGINFGLSVNNDTTYLHFTDLRVASFGSHGIELQSPETCHFDRVLVSSNGGDGFHVYGTGTSCHWNTCYALNNASGIGYHIIGLSYSSLSGCASDSNADGYSLSGCYGVALNGCGTENNGTDGYILSGGAGNSLTSCFIYANNHYGIHVTSSEVNATISSPTEHSPTGSAVNFIIVDSGCSAVVSNRNGVTVDSYAANTSELITPFGISGETWAPEDNGLLTANYDPGLTTATPATVAGTLYLVKLVIRRNMLITNVWWALQGLASGASTGSFSGLYSSAGTLLSGSSDIAAKVTSPVTVPNGIFIPLTTPQSVTAGSFVWAALLVNFATTQPTFHAADSSGIQPNLNLTAATYRYATNGTSLTSLPSSITPSSNSQAASFTYWAGVN